MAVDTSNAEVYLLIAPSTLAGAGDGMFAKTNIPENTHFPVAISTKTMSSIPPFTSNVSAITFTVPLFVSDDTSLDSECIVDGTITTLANVPLHFLSVLKPFYAHVNGDQVSMKANDFAWKPGIIESDYNQNESQNQLNLLLTFTTGQPVGLSLVNKCIVAKGEELGLTYGFEYWWSGSYCSQQYTDAV